MAFPGLAAQAAARQQAKPELLESPEQLSRNRTAENTPALVAADLQERQWISR